MMQGGLQAAIISFALRFRGIVLALGVVLLIYGAYAVVEAKYDVFPEFAPPQVAIQTEAAGLTAERVEMVVPQPLENSLNGLPGLRTIPQKVIPWQRVITRPFGRCKRNI